MSEATFRAFPWVRGNEVELGTQPVSVNLPVVAFVKEKGTCCPLGTVLVFPT